LPHKDPKANTQEGVGGETASVKKHETGNKTSSSSTSHKQEDAGGGSTAHDGPTREHKIRAKSSDSATSSKTTKGKESRNLVTYL
jgi:hypothetical protein